MYIRSVVKEKAPFFVIKTIKGILKFLRYFKPSPGPSKLQKFNIMVTQYCLGKVDKFILPEVRNFVFSDEITYCTDGLMTNHSVDWMYEPRFAEAYKLAEETGSFTTRAGIVNKVMWRIHTLCWVAHQAKQLEGDFIECGVARGAVSRAVVHYTDFKILSKNFYLLDTFSGFPEGSITQKERDMGISGSEYEDCYHEACETFKDFSNVKLIRGPIPDTLSQVPSKKIAFLHIDMNCAKPEIEAGEFFWNKLVKGAFIVLDDYGWYKFIHQREAWDAFALRKNIKILTLPTGQGLIIKP
ncbi:MAG: O-methyltransferase [Alteromonas naphthalenivorans]|jgi:O-methyltransferase